MRRLSAVASTEGSVPKHQADERVLNLGSGRDRSKAKRVTIDRVTDTCPDIVQDLDEYPWPLEDDWFDTVYCIDVIEHLSKIVRAMEEIHRTTRSGARVRIATPHLSCANSYTDPTHIHHPGFFYFDYFTGGNRWSL